MVLSLCSFWSVLVDPGERLADPSSDWRALMLGICALVLVLLLVGVVLVPYFLWRRGSVFIMKIMHFSQPDEQNGKSNNLQNLF